ncbi:hypothetical protein CKM354_000987900 [Cercospora kikuchii]|uniref:F-box domain-containing protein n=1 Tax=Cercospora kikuchii TaxID=84275 RepID=A0A9P3CP59_9PEZI|nr:uncharacterized protein CKM354_000987900 [Cercospora kikuchii]GIZ46767.1 hypothetical protein CKM354_000987900 [Cercospora kikuchii]
MLHNMVNSPSSATMAILDDDAATDPELEKIAAALSSLSATQRKKIQRVLLPERLRVANLKDSMLLRLPQELRDTIYELVLEDRRYTQPSPTLYRAFYPAPPVLFRVCHQIREEFARRFRENIFFAGSMDESKIRNRMSQVEPKHIKAIRRIHHNYYADRRGSESKRHAVEVAEEFELTFGLQKGAVWVTCTIYSDDGSDHFLFNGMANSLGEVEKKAYAEVRVLQCGECDGNELWGKRTARKNLSHK